MKVGVLSPTAPPSLLVDLSRVKGFLIDCFLPYIFMYGALGPNNIQHSLAVLQVSGPEPVFVDLLRGLGIDSEPGGTVQQPNFSY
jgi:hypothetical protein